MEKLTHIGDIVNIFFNICKDLDFLRILLKVRAVNQSHCETFDKLERVPPGLVILANFNSVERFVKVSRLCSFKLVSSSSIGKPGIASLTPDGLAS